MASSSKRAKTIEEVFNTPSLIVSSNLNPPPSDVVLTPRSAEACLRTGINPETLKIRDLDSFWEPEIDPTIQRMRHEAYIQRRHDLIVVGRRERQKIINEESSMMDNFARGNKGATLTAEDLLRQQEEQGATLLEMEKKRIEKLQRRQKKELEQMLEFEMERSRREAAMKQKMEEEKRREERKRKLKEKRMRQMAEERRLRELKKKAIEDAEEEKRRMLAREMFEREREIRERKQQEEEDLKRELREREVEKRRKLEEHQLQMQRAQEEQDRELRLRIAQMEEAEEKKMRQIEERKQKHKMELQRKRRLAKERIQKNIKSAKNAEKKRKTDFLRKQAHHEKLREAHLEKMDHDLMLASQQRYLNEQRRQMVLEEYKREEEQKKEEMLRLFEERDAMVEEVKQQRERELEIQKEKSKLRKQMKMENVNRVKRMNEFKRQQTMMKLREQEARVQNILQQKERLIEKRKQAALETKIKKDKLMEMMNEVRTSNTKANQLVKSLKQGKSLEDMVDQGSSLDASSTLSRQSLSSSSPSTTQQKKRGGKKKKGGKKKRKKGGTSSSSYPDEDEQASMDASRMLTSAGSDFQGDMESQQVLGPRPEVDKIRHMHIGQDSSEEPQPFISPYELGSTAEQGEGQTVTF